MSRPLPTPYDGRSPLFRIGAVKLDPIEWIDLDEDLPAHLAEKQRLFETRRDEVFAALPGTEAAQAELLALLVEHLLQRFPDSYRRSGDGVHIGPAGRDVPLTGPEPALLRAAGLVQEDLMLMRRGTAGWSLVAAALCFPSSWRLREKLGRPLDEIHATVPGFGAGTRHAELISRMFDMLRPETPMLRWNWSIYGDDALFHPDDSPPRRFGSGARADKVFLRVERQTLRKLPTTGDIVFAVRIYVDPLAALETLPQAPQIATALVAQLDALDEAQLAYKGLALERARLVDRLREIAER